MKAFEFKPKLFTTLQNYSKESFMADLMAGIIVGIVDGNGALGGRIICDTGYISSRSEVNVISFIVKTIYLATVMFKQIADSVSGVVFRLSDF